MSWSAPGVSDPGGAFFSVLKPGAHGGQGRREPGRFAVIGDDQGAFFAVIRLNEELRG